VAAYYPSKHLPSWDAVYRPTSLLGHFSAVGAFGLINCTLALALAAARVPGFRGAWLSLVILMNISALLASETWAPLIALPAVIALVLVYSRRIPPQLWVVLGVMVVAAALLWPFMSQRIDQQQLFAGSGSGIAVPETMEWRIRYWQEFFIPAAADNLWFGTATTIPSLVPPWIDTFVDNEYLYAIFRAGLPGVALLLGLFAAVGVVGWRERLSPVPEARALGAVCLASVMALALMGATSEYLTFAAVSQLFWMLVGLLAAVRATSDRAEDLIVLEVGAPPLRPASLEAIRA
jgi:O-antigen ligase